MLRVVFHTPEIPPNTGNAIRLVACAPAELHLVEPLGFTLEDKQLRRAGLDYHDLARVFVHESLDACFEALGVDGAHPEIAGGASYRGVAGDALQRGVTGDAPERGVAGGAPERGVAGGVSADRVGGARVFAFTRDAATSYCDIGYRGDDVLLFGRESDGLPDAVLDDPRVSERVRFPMLPGRRSLNLSNCAAIAVYEAWRQLGFAPEL